MISRAHARAGARKGVSVRIDANVFAAARRSTWKALIGKEPGKNHVKFHGLLHAARRDGARTSWTPEPDCASRTGGARGRERGGNQGKKVRINLPQAPAPSPIRTLS
jgi:hypothetical protein